jgi:inhibitor of KinA
VSEQFCSAFAPGTGFRRDGENLLLSKNPFADTAGVITLNPLGDCAVVLKFEGGPEAQALSRARTVADAINRDPPAGVKDVVPAFGNVTVFYNPPEIVSFPSLCAELKTRVSKLKQSASQTEARAVEIPVCYGGKFGPDLAEVAARAGLTLEQAVALHAGGDYFVQAVGFAPGFAYLGGLVEQLHTPRRATPRTLVPAGAVGIGGALTGVYPLATPGGWNLIGCTPTKMFDPSRPEPALVRAGDRVRFRTITPEEFAAWK